MSLLEYVQCVKKKNEKQYSVLSEKYKPETLSDFIGNFKQIQEIHKWFKSNDRLLLLLGHVGCGKTTLIDLFCKLYNKNIHRNSNIQKRSKKDLTKWYDNIKNASSNNIAIVDEIETIIARTEAMPLSELQKWTIEGSIKIVFIGDCLIQNKLKLFSKNKECTTIILEYPDTKQLYRHCMNIIDKENISYTNDDYIRLKNIINSKKSDPRSIIDQLYMSKMSIETKNKDIELYDAFKLMIDENTPFKDKLRIFGIDTGTIPILFQENYIDKKLTLEERLNIVTNMAFGDMFHKNMFSLTTNIQNDIYGCMSSIFPELYNKNITEPRFGLIWTKQSSKLQKQKYISQFYQKTSCPFYSHSDIHFLNEIIRHYTKGENKYMIDSLMQNEFSEVCVDDWFDIYVCIQLYEEKNMAKKVFVSNMRKM